MPPTIKPLEGRIGQDFYAKIRMASDADVSDWASWSLVAFLYDGQGTKLITCTESSGTIVRTATGEFYFWFKRAALSALARGDYFWQSRRNDAGNNTPLAEGPFRLQPYLD